MRRGPYAKVAARNAQLLERIRVIKAGHPFWGYRRVWAYLRYVDGLTVNQKRIYGIMKATELIVKPNPKLRAKRKADTRKPRPTRPNEWWGIDVTKVMIEGFGWVYAGLQARAWHWLVALNRAVNRQFPDGIEGQGVNLMADNGCQPTSLAFMRACAAMGIRQAFTSYSNPKGNADTERFLRTLKEELVWLREWTSPAAFFAALERWLVDYDATYLLPSAECGRSRIPWPCHSLSRGLLNGEQYIKVLDPLSKVSRGDAIQCAGCSWTTAGSLHRLYTSPAMFQLTQVVKFTDM